MYYGHRKRSLFGEFNGHKEPRRAGCAKSELGKEHRRTQRIEIGTLEIRKNIRD